MKENRKSKKKNITEANFKFLTKVSKFEKTNIVQF
jgi:hypothetical protein